MARKEDGVGGGRSSEWTGWALRVDPQGVAGPRSVYLGRGGTAQRHTHTHTHMPCRELSGGILAQAFTLRIATQLRARVGCHLPESGTPLAMRLGHRRAAYAPAGCFKRSPLPIRSPRQVRFAGCLRLADLPGASAFPDRWLVGAGEVLRGRGACRAGRSSAAAEDECSQGDGRTGCRPGLARLRPLCGRGRRECAVGGRTGGGPTGEGIGGRVRPNA